MHKLNIYLNDDRLEKIKILIGLQDNEAIEEWLNETIYSAIAEAWIRDKGAHIKEMLATGNYDDETVRVTVNEKEFDVWSDGDMAVITVDDSDLIVQMIDGQMYFVLPDEELVQCEPETQSELEKVLEAAGANPKERS